jgi:hypothetical protein
VPPPLRIKVSTYAICKRLVALLLEETPPYESREKSDDIRGGFHGRLRDALVGTLKSSPDPFWPDAATRPDVRPLSDDARGA